MATSSITYSDIFSVQNVIIGPAATFGLTLFVAGFYALLFGLSTYFLMNRRDINKKLHLAWTSAVFLIANLGALTRASNYIVDAVFYYDAVRTQDFGPLIAYTTGGSSQTAMLTLTGLCYIIANCIADAILIYRCHILYGSRKAILVPLVFISLATNALGVVATSMKVKAQSSNLESDSNWELFSVGSRLQIGYYCANAGVNGFLTLLLAGRIWWMAREARTFLQSQVHAIDRNYKSLASVIFESGMLYPITLIVHVVLAESTSKIGIPIDLTPIAILMAGIVPTLITVRISIGKSVEMTRPKVTAIRHDADARDPGTFRAERTSSSRSESISRTDDLEQQDHKY
ncbi:hypothetical protein Moror_1439 [Moniliophthora roreri MCA 2997]|uniref:Uncharacterized protein n=2 Tax=Moniliophthora roreri TaxID=221103 RepID=V2XLL9_MONRO|nr:hypothetical protein Moror_1439 [Moniliophthora roreri MCA 2997]